MQEWQNSGQLWYPLMCCSDKAGLCDPAHTLEGGLSCPRMVRLKHRFTIGVLEQSGRSKTAFSRHDIRDAIQVRLGLWLKQHQHQPQTQTVLTLIGAAVCCVVGCRRK